MNTVYITSAKRTPIGKFNGSLASLSSYELGAVVLGAVLQENGLQTNMVDEVIMGQVLTAGAGMNPARRAAHQAGLPDRATTFCVNQVCGSGLRAVALGAQQIQCGDANVVLAGGQESMSQAPHLAYIRQGKKLGDSTLTDSLFHDGLTDAFYGYPMGMTAENLAEQYSLDRETQDAFAFRSQRLAAEATSSGAFRAESVPVVAAGDIKTEILTVDEHFRPDITTESLAGLQPAFKKDGTVTAGNASGINDGAAAVALMSETAINSAGIAPLARIVSWATAGLSPAIMGLGPVPASELALKKAGWSRNDVDLWEINEAFAAQALAVLQELDLDPDRVNVNGGAIALGHPIGASGARILVTLLHSMKARQATRGVATLCIGGGMGIALCVENLG